MKIGCDGMGWRRGKVAASLLLCSHTSNGERGRRKGCERRSSALAVPVALDEPVLLDWSRFVANFYVMYDTKVAEINYN